MGRIIFHENRKVYLLTKDEFTIFLNSNATFKISEEEVASGSYSLKEYAPQSRKTGRYHFTMRANITEELVGISGNSHESFHIYWELIDELKLDDLTIMIFSGWGDFNTSGGLSQFEGYEIGVQRNMLEDIIIRLIKFYPDTFPLSKMQNVIGLENFYSKSVDEQIEIILRQSISHFEKCNGKIRHGDFERELEMLIIYMFIRKTEFLDFTLDYIEKSLLNNIKSGDLDVVGKTVEIARKIWPFRFLEIDSKHLIEDISMNLFTFSDCNAFLGKYFRLFHQIP